VGCGAATLQIFKMHSATTLSVLACAKGQMTQFQGTAFPSSGVAGGEGVYCTHKTVNEWRCSRATPFYDPSRPLQTRGAAGACDRASASSLY